jgi:cobalamin biosynthesis protein CobT
VNPPASPAADPNTSLNPRIDEVEKEVKKLKTDVENFMELKNTVEDLKNTIVDIRALMSETQNPFNLLQFITDENDLNKVIQAKPLLEKKLASNKAENKEQTKNGAVETKAADAAGTARKEVGFAVESQVEDNEAAVAETTENDAEKGEEIMDKVEDENQVQEEEICDMAEESSISNTSKGTALIHWMYKMLDLGFDERSIRKICDYCEFSCYMPKGYSEHVSNLVGAIVRARSQKISAEEFILSIYSAADAVGAKVDSKDLSGLMINVLRKNKMSGQ